MRSSAQIFYTRYIVPETTACLFGLLETGRVSTAPCSSSQPQGVQASHGGQNNLLFSRIRCTSMASRLFQSGSAQQKLLEHELYVHQASLNRRLHHRGRPGRLSICNLLKSFPVLIGTLMVRSSIQNAY